MNGWKEREIRRLVERFLSRRNLLSPGDRVVVALSGGPDSVALLRLLVELSQSWEFEVHAAHVNHRLRGKESDRDEVFVGTLCEALDVPLAGRSYDVPAYDGNLEDTARRLRYQFLAERARNLNAVIATGHTRDDQAETFLMKLVRGSGPGGLSAIHPVLYHPAHISDRKRTRSARMRAANSRDVIKIVRPLLEVTRSQVLEYLDECRQEYRLDSSNEDLNFDRNWVRRSLLPLLEERLNPRIVETISRSATIFSELNEYLEQEADRYEAEALTEEGVMSVHVMQSLPLPLQRVLTRRALRIAGNREEISFSHTDDILKLCEATSGKSINLPGGIKAIKEFDQIRLTTDLDGPEPFSYILRVPGQLTIPEVGKTLTVCSPCPSPEDCGGEAESRSDGVVCLPEGCQVTVRNRRPGDRVRCSTKSSPRKLKKHFLDRRTPLSERDRVLLLEWEGQIIWIEGFPEEVAVGPRELEEESAASLVEMCVSCETFLS